MKKVSLLIVVIITIVCLGLALAACENVTAPTVQQRGFNLNFNTVYALAEEAGYNGTLEELVEMFKGDNAYQLAVAAGYKGTQEEWLQSLVGATGAEGVTPHIGDNKHWFVGDTDTGVVAEGRDGADGADGTDGRDGVDGNGILRIEQTATEGLVDTYTIYYTDGTTTTFAITNGRDGADGKDGIDGVNGADGKDGIDGVDGQDGADGADATGTTTVAPVHPHDADTYEKIFVEATCGDDGLKCIVCSECNEILTWYLLPKGGEHDLHSYTVEATCYQPGYIYYYCKNCNYEYQEEVSPALGHRFSESYSYDYQYHWHEAICGHEDAVTKEEHDFAGGNTCVACGYSTSIDSLGENATVVKQLVIFAEQYLTNDATDTLDNSTNLAKALTKEANIISGRPIRSVTVSLESDNCYGLLFTFKDYSTFYYHQSGSLAARVVKNGRIVGYQHDNLTHVDFLSSLADVYNAFLMSMQQAMSQPDMVVFETDENNPQVVNRISVHSMPFRLYLHDGLNEDTISTDSLLSCDITASEWSIEITMSGNDTVLFGIYYRQANKELYFYYENREIRITESSILVDIAAVLSTLFEGLLGEQPFYLHEANYTSISDAVNDLAQNDSAGVIMSILATLFDCGSVDMNGGTRYQYQIDLGTSINAVLSNAVLGPIISGALNGVIENVMPQLDLSTFQGVGGVLTLSFDVTDGMLAGVQVAYNVSQKDFRWNSMDDEQKLYGPINFAFTISR